MNSAQNQDGGTRPAGHSKIPSLRKPGSTLLQPLLTTPLVPDSGLWTAVHLLCGERASSENMTFAQNVAGQQESLPGTALPFQAPNPCPVARSGHRGSGSARPPARAGRAWRRGRGCYFKWHCGRLTNRCGRRFSFRGQWCSQPPAAWALWTAPQGQPERAASHGKGRAGHRRGQ